MCACSVMSNSLRPHGLEPTRLLCPWDFPGKNTGVGCHFLLLTLSFYSNFPLNVQEMISLCIKVNKGEKTCTTLLIPFIFSNQINPQSN